MEKQYFQSANVFIHHNTIDVKMTFGGGENDLKKKKMSEYHSHYRSASW